MPYLPSTAALVGSRPSARHTRSKRRCLQREAAACGETMGAMLGRQMFKVVGPCLPEGSRPSTSLRMRCAVSLAITCCLTLPLSALPDCPSKLLPASLESLGSSRPAAVSASECCQKSSIHSSSCADLFNGLRTCRGSVPSTQRLRQKGVSLQQTLQ